MTTRITDRNEMEALYQQMIQFGSKLASTELEPALMHLVVARFPNQRCANCMALHTREALEDGDRVDRLAVLCAWRETNWFSDRERAALPGLRR